MALIRAILIGTKEKFMTCNADNIGKTLFSNLIAGEDFSIPEVDFSDPKWALPASLDTALQADVKSVELEDLTEFLTVGHACMVQQYADMVIPVESSISFGPSFGEQFEIGNSPTAEAIAGGLKEMESKYAN